MKLPVISNMQFSFKRAFWLILPVFLLLVLECIGFNGLYGQDSYEYLLYSRSIHNYLLGGELPGQYFWPVLFPLSGALLSFLLPDILALQIVSLFSFGLTLVFLHKILIRLFPENSSGTFLYLVLFYSLSPFILRVATTIMSEATAMLFIAIFFYYYIRIVHSFKRTDFLIMVIAGLAAINTRYATFIIIMIPGLHALILFLRKFHMPTLVFSMLIACTVFLPNFLLSIYEPGSIFGQVHLVHWNLKNFFRNSFQTADGHLTYACPNICFVFSNLINPGYIFTGVPFMIFFRIRILKIRFFQVILAVILFYSLFLAGISFQNNRILLLSFPCLIILFSDTFLYISEQLKKWKQPYQVLLIVLVVSVQVALFCRAFKPFYNDNRQTKYIIGRIQNYPGKLIYTMGIDQALKGYKCNNEIVNLWESRQENFRSKSLVLFNLEKFSEQWKGFNPMINWENMNRGHHLILLEEMPGGWNLYEITD